MYEQLLGCGRCNERYPRDQLVGAAYTGTAGWWFALVLGRQGRDRHRPRLLARNFYLTYAEELEPPEAEEVLERMLGLPELLPNGQRFVGPLATVYRCPNEREHLVGFDDPQELTKYLDLARERGAPIIYLPALERVAAA
jgi:hypothetical protein